jgi:hypoxanthine phosphoribosyltransferase
MEGLPVIEKQFNQPAELRRDSFALGAKVLRSGFKPDLMVALWRGGAPIGCYMHELFKFKGVVTDHVAIRTSKYIGIGQGSPTVHVHSTSYVLDRIRDNVFNPCFRILLVDDVWDSGSSILAFLDKLRADLAPGKYSLLDIRIATVYYKPTKNRSMLQPDYYMHESDAWLVFPHELEGLTMDEIVETMGNEVAEVLK